MDSLPNELKLHIFKYLPGPDVRRMRRLSPQYSALIENNYKHLNKIPVEEISLTYTSHPSKDDYTIVYDGRKHACAMLITFPDKETTGFRISNSGVKGMDPKAEKIIDSLMGNGKSRRFTTFLRRFLQICQPKKLNVDHGIWNNNLIAKFGRVIDETEFAFDYLETTMINAHQILNSGILKENALQRIKKILLKEEIFSIYDNWSSVQVITRDYDVRIIARDGIGYYMMQLIRVFKDNQLDSTRLGIRFIPQTYLSAYTKTMMDSLPNELKLHIFQYLPGPDVRRMRRLSSVYKNLVQNNTKYLRKIPVEEIFLTYAEHPNKNDYPINLDGRYLASVMIIHLSDKEGIGFRITRIGVETLDPKGEKLLNSFMGNGKRRGFSTFLTRFLLICKPKILNVDHGIWNNSLIAKFGRVVDEVGFAFDYLLTHMTIAHQILDSGLLKENALKRMKQVLLKDQLYPLGHEWRYLQGIAVNYEICIIARQRGVVSYVKQLTHIFKNDELRETRLGIRFIPHTPVDLDIEDFLTFLRSQDISLAWNHGELKTFFNFTQIPSLFGITCNGTAKELIFRTELDDGFPTVRFDVVNK